MSGADEIYMRRAIDLARAVLGATGENPSVGCVIVKGGEVLAEAATGPGGRPHAEEQALQAAGERARSATAYVTLEPCGERSAGGVSCAERLAKAGVVRVLAACVDASAYAGGRGGALLAAAGVTMETGLLADEAEPLYESYLPRLSKP